MIPDQKIELLKLKLISMKTRTLLIAIVTILVSSGLFAQESPPIHYKQFGFNFSSLNSFGLHFKTGNEKTLFRLNLLALDLGQNSEWGRPQDSIDLKSSSFGFGIRAGFEKHIPVAARFDFIWGIEAGINMNYQKMKQHGIYYNDYETSSWSVAPLIDVVLGATYTISDHLVFGAEITPGIRYSFGKTKSTYPNNTIETTDSDFSFGFSNNSANLSVAYRFGK